MNNKKETTGPASYENWKAWSKSNTPNITYEYPLYSDAHITGELLDNFGPYELFNTIPINNSFDVPSLVLRLDYYLEIEHEKNKLDKTDTSKYHGGDIVDEITALISLIYGIRLMAGGQTREFRDNDPKGRPIAYGSYMKQPLIFKMNIQNPILPQKLDNISLLQNELLEKFKSLSTNDANVLVKVARMYQNALWISEFQPELSWIMLVSAIELAANHWRRTKESPVERFRLFNPKLYDFLEEKCAEEIVQKVASEISNYMGATKTFVDFILEYLPDEPARRPKEFACIDWTKDSFKKYLKQIYNYRSQFLHSGTPIPYPMCHPPMKHGEVYEERPSGLTTYYGNAIWQAKDTPMLLHTFEYIVRNVLIKWWDSFTAP